MPLSVVAIQQHNHVLAYRIRTFPRLIYNHVLTQKCDCLNLQSLSGDTFGDASLMDQKPCWNINSTYSRNGGYVPLIQYLKTIWTPLYLKPH